MERRPSVEDPPSKRLRHEEPAAGLAVATPLDHAVVSAGVDLVGKQAGDTEDLLEWIHLDADEVADGFCDLLEQVPRRRILPSAAASFPEAGVPNPGIVIGGGDGILGLPLGEAESAIDSMRGGRRKEVMELGATEFTVTNPRWEPWVSIHAAPRAPGALHLPAGTRLSAQLHSLVIQPAGAHAWHLSDPLLDASFAYLVLALPSQAQDGHIAVTASFGQPTATHAFSSNAFQTSAVFLFRSTSHSIEAPSRGHRLLLVYELRCADAAVPAPSLQTWELQVQRMGRLLQHWQKLLTAGNSGPTALCHTLVGRMPAASADALLSTLLEHHSTKAAFVQQAADRAHCAMFLVNYHLLREGEPDMSACGEKRRQAWLLKRRKERLQSKITDLKTSSWSWKRKYANLLAPAMASDEDDEEEWSDDEDGPHDGCDYHRMEGDGDDELVVTSIDSLDKRLNHYSPDAAPGYRLAFDPNTLLPSLDYDTLSPALSPAKEEWKQPGRVKHTHRHAMLVVCSSATSHEWEMTTTLPNVQIAQRLQASLQLENSHGQARPLRMRLVGSISPAKEYDIGWAMDVLDAVCRAADPDVFGRFAAYLQTIEAEERWKLVGHPSVRDASKIFGYDACRDLVAKILAKDSSTKPTAEEAIVTCRAKIAFVSRIACDLSPASIASLWSGALAEMTTLLPLEDTMLITSSITFLGGQTPAAEAAFREHLAPLLRCPHYAGAAASKAPSGAIRASPCAWQHIIRAVASRLSVPVAQDLLNVFAASLSSASKSLPEMPAACREVVVLACELGVCDRHVETAWTVAFALDAVPVCFDILRQATATNTSREVLATQWARTIGKQWAVSGPALLEAVIADLVRMISTTDQSTFALKFVASLPPPDFGTGQPSCWEALVFALYPHLHPSHQLAPALLVDAARRLPINDTTTVAACLRLLELTFRAQSTASAVIPEAVRRLNSIVAAGSGPAFGRSMSQLIIDFEARYAHLSNTVGYDLLRTEPHMTAMAALRRWIYQRGAELAWELSRNPCADMAGSLHLLSIALRDMSLRDVVASRLMETVLRRPTGPVHPAVESFLGQALAYHRRVLGESYPTPSPIRHLADVALAAHLEPLKACQAARLGRPRLSCTCEPCRQVERFLQGSETVLDLQEKIAARTHVEAGLRSLNQRDLDISTLKSAQPHTLRVIKRSEPVTREDTLRFVRCVTASDWQMRELFGSKAGDVMSSCGPVFAVAPPPPLPVPLRAPLAPKSTQAMGRSDGAVNLSIKREAPPSSLGSMLS